eukprot:860567-Rhodomonas_salina.1
MSVPDMSVPDISMSVPDRRTAVLDISTRVLTSQPHLEPWPPPGPPALAPPGTNTPGFSTAVALKECIKK